MNIEELKLILETLSAAGEGAYTLGLLWILKGYFSDLLGVGIAVGGLIVICKLAAPAIRSSLLEQELLRAAKVYPYLSFSPMERAKLVRIVAKYYPRIEE
jgi:hypothetical protein